VLKKTDPLGFFTLATYDGDNNPAIHGD